MRQRDVRVGSDKCFTFVRRVTQDTAGGGMRTPSLRLGGFVIPVRAKKEHTIWCALFLVSQYVAKSNFYERVDVLITRFIISSTVLQVLVVFKLI